MTIEMAMEMKMKMAMAVAIMMMALMAMAMLYQIEKPSKQINKNLPQTNFIRRQTQALQA